MRDSKIQTPQNDQTTAYRRSKSTPDIGKKHCKSLNPSFAAISEDNVSEFSKENTNFSSPMETSIHKSAKNSVISPVNSVVVPSPGTIVHVDQTPPSSSKSGITSDEHAASSTSLRKCESPEMNSIKNLSSVEAEMVIKHLTAARIQVLKSEVEPHSRKLLDVLLKAIIEEFHRGMYEERHLIHKLVTSKANLIFLSFMLGILAVFVFLFLNFGESAHPTIQIPT